MTGYMSYGPGLCSWRRDEDLICALLEKTRASEVMRLAGTVYDLSGKRPPRNASSCLESQYTPLAQHLAAKPSFTD